MKKLLNSSLLVWAACNTACTLEIPNVPICADKGKFGAICAYTRGDVNKKQIPKLQWDNMRVGMFCMDAKALGDYKTFIEKACQQDQKCVDGVRRFIDVLEDKPVPAKSLDDSVDERTGYENWLKMQSKGVSNVSK
jgi:hypothetical protein